MPIVLDLKRTPIETLITGGTIPIWLTCHIGYVAAATLNKGRVGVEPTKIRFADVCVPVPPPTRNIGRSVTTPRCGSDREPFQVGDGYRKADPVGFEPTTSRVTAERSATELRINETTSGGHGTRTHKGITPVTR